MSTGVQITGLIEPLNGGAFPVFEDINGLGGWRAVADTTARNAIPANSRKNGMVVVAQDTGIAWQLVGGILDANWVVFSALNAARIYLTAQSAAIGVTNVFAALPLAGLFRISAYLDVTTAGTAGSTLATRVNYTPDDGAASFSIVTSARDIGTLGGSQGSVIVESNGAAQITYEVDLVGAIGAGVYSLRLVAESL